MTIKAAITAAAVVALLQCGVAAGAEDSSIAAWVNKKPVTEAQVIATMQPVLERIHKKLGRTPDGIMRLKVRAKALQSLIDHEVALASKEAKDVHITPEALDQRITETIKRKCIADLETFKVSLVEEGISWDVWQRGLKEIMIIEEMKNNMETLVAPCTDAEAEALYHESPALFQSGGRVKVSLIKLDFEEIDTGNPNRFAIGLANRVFEASNEEWEDAAAEYSSGPKAQEGGHWDWTEPALLPEGLGKIVAHMHVGAFERTSTENYTYLLRLDAIEQAVQLTFEQAKEQAKQEVVRRKTEAAWQAWLTGEKKKASIRMKDEDLW